MSCVYEPVSHRISETELSCGVSLKSTRARASVLIAKPHRNTINRTNIYSEINVIIDLR